MWDAVNATWLEARRLRDEDFTPENVRRLLDWVKEVAALTEPDSVYWVDGSQEEYDRLAAGLVEAGTFVKLAEDKFPNSYAAFSDPADVARVEDRTFICSEKEEDAGFTNNWMEPGEMKGILRDAFAGSMHGRTMYVIPFVMGHLDAEDPKFGVEITDEVADGPQSLILKQVSNGVAVRMAALEALLAGK